MTIRQRAAALVAASAVLLAGCASTAVDTGAKSTSTPTGGAAMTPGRVMPDGSTMGASSPWAHVAAAPPSAAAKMICSAEVRSDIAAVLAVTSVAAPTSDWTDHVLTCTYRLPAGTFVLSVTESTSSTTARGHAVALRKQLGNPPSAAGLTDLAFATPNGTVTLVKDNDTLRVDASRLPAQFGIQQQKRGDFAYEIASDILGCWTDG